MFVAVTPINEVTGVPTGQPVWLNKAQIVSLQRKSASGTNVDYCIVETTCHSNEIIYVKEMPEEILTIVNGSMERE